MEHSIGIIGCGGIARAHAQAYVTCGAKIAGLTDVRPEAAAALANELGGAPVYSDYSELLDSAQASAVSICTPPAAHEEAAVRALQRGVHVLCEKPMALDVPSAHRMRAAAEGSRALLMPAFRHRFLPPIIALREMLQSGALGDIVLYSNTFCGPAFAMEGRWFTKKEVAGGGCLLDTTSHSVDLFRFVVGEVVDQKALMHRHFRTTDVEDAATLLVKSTGGALGSLSSSFVAGSGVATIDIIGTKGRACYNYDEATTLRHRLTADTAWRERALPESVGFREEVAHFLGAIEGEHGLACTADDGVRAMEIICAAY